MSGRGGGDRPVARIVRLLLRAYPRGHRERYGPELLRVVEEERRAGRGGLGFWVWILSDLVVSVIRMRVSAWRNDEVRAWVPRERSMDVVRQDVRFAIRMLVRTPLFTLAAVATIALGVGANTTMFGAVHAVLLRGLPMRAPEELAIVRLNGEVSASKRQLEEVREASRAMEVGAWSGWGMTLTGGGDPAAVQGARVSADFFALLGAEAARGRIFTAGDDAPGSGDLAILSDALWRTRLGADPAVVGQTVTIGGRAHTVVGVMPREFRFPTAATQIWVPLVLDPADVDDWTTGYLTLIGRLRPGTTTAVAQDELRTIARTMRERRPEYGETFGSDASVIPLRDHLARGARSMLLLLLCASAGVLLIACVNVTNLLLARASVREAELATRGALGASPLRIATQLATESLVLTLAGGVGGVLLALGATNLFSAALPPDLHGAADVRVAPAVLAFSLGITVLAGLLIGVLPAARAARSRIGRTLREAGRVHSLTRRRRLLLNGLVVAQIGLAAALVAASILMLRSFWNLRTEVTGFRTAEVLTMNIAPPPAQFTEDADVAAYWDRVLERVRAVPGVRHAGGVHLQPFGGSNWNPSVRVRDRDVPPSERPEVYWRIATPDYFNAAGIPLRAGRIFDARDHAAADGVAIVSETFAREVLGTDDPLGREIRTGFEPQNTWVRIVGVVGDTKDMALANAVMPQMYRPMAQWPVPILSLMVRTSVEPMSLAAPVRRAIWEVARDVPISDLRTFTAIISDSVRQPRLVAGLLVTFGALALVLGAIGIYGVLSYVVTQRRTELGIRLALGARQRTLLLAVVREAVLMALAGGAMGAVLAWTGNRLLRSQLYEIQPADPWAPLLATATLLTVAVLAALLPARAAARVDPMQSMRMQ